MDVLLLDFNGVVVNDEPLHEAALRAVLDEEGVPLATDAYHAVYLGLNDRTAFGEAYRRAGRELDPALVPHLIARKAEAYAARAATDLTAVPGVTAFVRAVAAEARVAVVSGAVRPEIERGLVFAGIRDVVATIVSPDDIATTKPDPEGFRLALQRVAGDGATVRAVAIEDSLHGLEAARAAGAGCVAVTTTFDAAALAEADAVWTSFEGHTPADLDALWRTVEVR